MTKQPESCPRPKAPILGALAALVLGALGTSADAVMQFQSETGFSPASGWIDELDENADGGNSLPGGFSVEDGEDPPPDYRSHSDVPDLPDGTGGSDPEAASAGGYHNPPRRPRLSDTFDHFNDVGESMKDVLTRDALEMSGASALSAPASPIPGPATLVLFGAAGLGAARRRRR